MPQHLVDNDQSMNMKVLNFHKWSVEEVMEIIYHIEASATITGAGKQAIKSAYGIEVLNDSSRIM
jgi:hypothetical protein